MQIAIRDYISNHKEETLQIIRDLCAIPAPSHFEHERAQWCKAWLDKNCGKGAYIDEALNVIFPMNCTGKNDLTVFAAHTDTVFPDREAMPYREDEEKIYSPGVSDNTASVAVLLMTVKFLTAQNFAPECGILFVCNSCEEGLGDLKGTKRLFSDFAGRIGRFISFDCNLNVVNDTCVGSHRYEVEVKTEGGHSYGAFGKENAIANLAKIACEIYKLEVPKKAGTRTTYNVGTIEGGTSVNTIAQNAKMLCEYRSDDAECMDRMQKEFARIFEEARSEKVQVGVTLVGDRPCGNIDRKKTEDMKQTVLPIIEDVIKEPVTFCGSSTDCNIPLSLGIAAICIGVRSGGGDHTREEWVEKASLVPGLEIGIRAAIAFGGGML